MQEKKGKKKKKNKNKVDSDPLAKSASVGVMPSYMSPVIPRSATTTSVAGKFNQEPHYVKKFEYSRQKKVCIFSPCEQKMCYEKTDSLRVFFQIARLNNINEKVIL